MTELSAIAILTAFGAGIISFLSPRVLPLVPGYISYVAGDALAHARHANDRAQRLSVLGLSFCFVAGFSTVFVALGAGAGMVFMGFAMITGMLTTLAFWLLNTFPAFAVIG